MFKAFKHKFFKDKHDDTRTVSETIVSFQQFKQHKDMVKEFSELLYTVSLLDKERLLIDDLKILFSYYEDYLKVKFVPVIRYHIRCMFASSMNHAIGLINSTHFALQHSRRRNQCNGNHPYNYVITNTDKQNEFSYDYGDNSITGIYNIEWDFKVSPLHDTFYHRFQENIPKEFLKYNDTILKQLTVYINVRNDIRVSPTASNKSLSEADIRERVVAFSRDLEIMLDHLIEKVEDIKQQIIGEIKQKKREYRVVFNDEVSKNIKQDGALTARLSSFDDIKQKDVRKRFEFLTNGDTSNIDLHMHPFITSSSASSSISVTCKSHRQKNNRYCKFHNHNLSLPGSCLSERIYYNHDNIHRNTKSTSTHDANDKHYCNDVCQMTKYKRRPTSNYSQYATSSQALDKCCKLPCQQVQRSHSCLSVANNNEHETKEMEPFRYNIVPYDKLASDLDKHQSRTGFETNHKSLDPKDSDESCHHEFEPERSCSSMSSNEDYEEGNVIRSQPPVGSVGIEPFPHNIIPDAFNLDEHLSCSCCEINDDLNNDILDYDDVMMRGGRDICDHHPTILNDKIVCKHHQ